MSRTLYSTQLNSFDTLSFWAATHFKVIFVDLAALLRLSRYSRIVLRHAAIKPFISKTREGFKGTRTNFYN